MTAYATAAQYDAAQGVQGQAPPDRDAVALAALELVLEAQSRVLDSRLLVHPGDLAPVADAATRTFDVRRAGKLLYLRDELGLASFLRTATAITRGGSPVPATLRPRNDRPARALYLADGWRAGDVVAVTGLWGLEAIPAAAVQWVAASSRQLRDIELAGASASVNVLGDAVEVRDDSWRILRQLAATLSRDVGVRL